MFVVSVDAANLSYQSVDGYVLEQFTTIMDFDENFEEDIRDGITFNCMSDLFDDTESDD